MVNLLMKALIRTRYAVACVGSRHIGTFHQTSDVIDYVKGPCLVCQANPAKLLVCVYSYNISRMS